jgi:hypothetical protein
MNWTYDKNINHVVLRNEEYFYFYRDQPDLQAADKNYPDFTGKKQAGIIKKMCEVVNTEKPVIPDNSEKMKRMATALKALGGWFSYFLGVSALGLGTLTPLGIDLFTIIIGFIITGCGLYLLHQHVVQKNLSGRARLVKGIKYTGSLLLLPGFIGKISVGRDLPVSGFFALLFYTGLLIFISSFILSRLWGIKKMASRHGKSAS